MWEYLVLGILVLISLIAMIVCLVLRFQSCQGNYRMKLEADGELLSICGTSGKEACLFTKTNINDCLNTCDLLDYCKYFSFEESTSTMKIVQPTFSERNGFLLFKKN